MEDKKNEWIRLIEAMQPFCLHSVTVSYGIVLFQQITLFKSLLMVSDYDKKPITE
jgi:hypothetical protein